MALPAGQYIKISGAAFSGAGFSVGDVIVINGSSSNNGIYTINVITTDLNLVTGAVVYEYLGLSGPAITDEDGSGINVENITLGGNKIICIGDEDSGSVGMWSYNDATVVDGTGSILDAPSVGTSGWSNAAIYPMISGSNAKYIFTAGQSAIRVCDTNIGNTSIIKHFSYINRNSFADNSGGIFAGFYEHSNILSKPNNGGYVNYNNTEKEAYGINDDGTTTVKTDFHLRRSLGSVSSGAYIEGESNYVKIKNISIDSTDILATEEIFHLEDAEDIAKIPLDSVIGLASYPRLDQETQEHITTTADKDFSEALGGGTNDCHWAAYNGSGTFVQTGTGTFAVSGAGLVIETSTLDALQGGSLTYTNLDGSGGSYPFKANKLYKVSMNIQKTAGSNLTGFAMSLGGQSTPYFVITTANVLYEKEIITANSTGSLLIYNRSTTAGEFTINNVSVKEQINYLEERMLVRTINRENYSMRVYRGYANSIPLAIEFDKNNKYLVQYGCGFNFKAIQGSADSGTYVIGDYEFAQSFVYDENQESLLRTPSNFSYATSETANRISITANAVAVNIQVYAFGPYNGRVSGGRIYVREVDSDEKWALFVDIDIVRGCRTSIDGEFKRWVSATGTDSIPSDCFHCGTSAVPLISTGQQLDLYEDINNYYPEIRKNSIGILGESYQAAATGGERAWIGNVKLQQDTGSIERFGDRVMYSEFGKYDVFPSLNWFTASKGDAEDITALQYFGDRLLIFKNRTLHIWNVASSEPFNWLPERTVQFGGVEHHYSVSSTPYGIVWANRTGCYFYDGEQVVDLTENKIRDIQNSYHGVPPSWDEFISSSTSLQRPMIIYSPKEKQIYILRDPLGGSTSNQCYIYNFMTRGWVYNTSMFTSATKYTNPIVDWNGNVVIAQDTYSAPTTSYLGNNITLSSAYDKDELITAIRDTDFNAGISGTGNWVIYNPDGTTFGAAPAISGNALTFQGTQLGNATEKKEGVSLPDGDVSTSYTNHHYKITATLSANDVMTNVPFFFEFNGNSISIGEITTTPTQYSSVLIAGTGGDLIIYKMSSGHSTDYGNRIVTIDDVSIKSVGIFVSHADHGFRFNDYININDGSNPEWFRVKSINPNNTRYIEVEGAQLGTSSYDHNTGATVGRSTATFKQLSSASVSTAKPSFITKDLDFDKPGIVKKIYKIYITYKNTAGSDLDNSISVSTDGNTTWLQGSITSGQSINTTAGVAITPTLTGTFVASQAQWNVAVFSFNKPLHCQSLSLWFNRADSVTGVSINDITFEFKEVHRKVS